MRSKKLCKASDNNSSKYANNEQQQGNNNQWLIESPSYFPMHFKISTIIFDMDGVITDTMPYHFRAWKSVLASQGLSVSHEDIYKREGQKGIDSVREIFMEKGKIYTDGVGRKILQKKEELFKKNF